MTQYMILIYENEAAYENVAPEAWASMLDAHNAFAKAVSDIGATVLAGAALQPTSTATSVRSGEVTDGPFVETKEALGGYYLVDARDLDQALQIAKLCPAPNGGVELRPVMDTSADAMG